MCLLRQLLSKVA